MRNIYVVRLAKAVKIDRTIPHFGSSDTHNLYVVASSFQSAQEAVERKHPGVDIRGIDLLNYNGVPIVLGE